MTDFNQESKRSLDVTSPLRIGMLFLLVFGLATSFCDGPFAATIDAAKHTGIGTANYKKGNLEAAITE